MIWLVLGLILWSGAHLLKRASPDRRAAIQDRFGNAARGLIAGTIVVSIILMIVGYRAAEFAPVWEPPASMVHLNNLLNLAAVVLFGASHSKSRLRGATRHPQLIGFSLWCIAHLLVNGDAASIVLWGVLLAWAVAEIMAINAREPQAEPYSGGTVAGDLRLAVISIVAFAAISAVHAWLGVWPFPA